MRLRIKLRLHTLRKPMISYKVFRRIQIWLTISSMEEYSWVDLKELFLTMLSSGKVLEGLLPWIKMGRLVGKWDLELVNWRINLKIPKWASSTKMTEADKKQELWLPYHQISLKNPLEEIPQMAMGIPITTTILISLTTLSKLEIIINYNFHVH